MLVAKFSIFCVLLCTQLVLRADGSALWGDDDEEDYSIEISFPPTPAAPPPPPPPTAPKNQSLPSPPISVFNSPPLSGNSTASNSTASNSTTNSTTVHDHGQKAAVGGGALPHYANYNETCGSSHPCDTTKDLMCSENSWKCICSTGTDAKLTFVPSLDKCLSVSAKSTSFSCIRNEQCHEGSFGPYSMCDTTTGRCKCLESSGPPANFPIVQKDDKCWIAKKLGDYCTRTEECEASISGKAICIYKPKEDDGSIGPAVLPINATMQCLCDEGFVADLSSTESLRECLATATDERSSCRKDVQCTAGLGPLSRCFQQTCQCADVVTAKGEAVFYKGKCYIRLGLEDRCESDVECQAGIHDDAVCVNHESYLEKEKVCKCPEGKTCMADPNGAAGPLLASISLFIVAFTATRAIALS